MAVDRVYPDLGAVPSAPAPPGANYNVKDQSIPPPGPPGAHYNAKEQPIPPPATYQDRQRGRSSSCRNCVIAVVAIHILIGLAILIFWLVVHPRAPRFDVQTLHISGLTGTSPANTTITYAIQARNPNKKRGFYYSDINVKVEASGDIIGQGTVDSFYQGHKNTTYLNGVISSLNVVLGSDALTSISRDRSNVPIYAQVDLKVKKVGSIKTRKSKVKVKCDINADLTVTSGSQLKSSKCKVK